jgi:hypothetical protein
MNQSDIVNAATQAAQKSKTFVGRQVDRQATALGATLTQTAHDLEQIGNNLRSSGTIGSAAQVADWAAGYVARAGTYLSSGDTDRFIADVETLSRERPWTIAASAAALGFMAARVVKSSSARRLRAPDYVEYSSGPYGYEGSVSSAAPGTAGSV